MLPYKITHSQHYTIGIEETRVLSCVAVETLDIAAMRAFDMCPDEPDYEAQCAAWDGSSTLRLELRDGSTITVERVTWDALYDLLPIGVRPALAVAFVEAKGGNTDAQTRLLAAANEYWANKYGARSSGLEPSPSAPANESAGEDS